MLCLPMDIKDALVSSGKHNIRAFRIRYMFVVGVVFAKFNNSLASSLLRPLHVHHWRDIQQFTRVVAPQAWPSHVHHWRGICYIQQFIRVVAPQTWASHVHHWRGMGHFQRRAS